MNNWIHDMAVIEEGAQLGTGNIIGPFCYIARNVVLGSNNVLHSHVSIGNRAQHRDSSRDYIYIGDRNQFWEFCTVHKPTVGFTTIGHDCFFMAGSHISHDTHIEDGVTMANNVLLGGHTLVMRGANIGLGVLVHQRQIIGSYSMIGMGAVITKKCVVRPGYTYVGSPAREIGKNEVGLARADVSEELLQAEIQRFEQRKMEVR